MNSKPHIVCSVTNDLTYDRRMFRICSALAGAGYEVTLVGRVRKNSKSFQPAIFNSKRIRCVFSKGFLFYVEFNIRLFFFLLKTRFDIACACDLDTALPAVIASKIKGKKKVYDAHEYFSEVPELTGRPLVKSVWQCIARFTIPKFDVCYTVGDALAVLMGKVYKVHFGVIRNIAPASPDDEIIPKSIQPREKIMLYQGALNVGRGLEVCMEAMQQLPEWKFWLAGEGDISASLQAQSKRLGLDTQVKFLGWVKPEDLPALMSKAMISINLRERGSLNDYYSLPNKFFDAIHAGLPSIHMNYPEYAHIISKYPCALLLDEVDVQKIVSAVERITHEPEMWNKMVDACRLAAKEYTWAEEEKKLLAMYSNL